MNIIRRPATDEERKALLQSRSFIQRLLRPSISEPLGPAEVEVLRFRVHRAWNGIACLGPPCCPNTWLVETSDDTFVWIQSWTFLTAVDGQFPGSEVTLVRECGENAILSASVAGSPSPTCLGGESLLDFDGEKVEVYKREAVPDALLRGLDA